MGTQVASTRRDFIKGVGVAIASLMMARCICPVGGDEGDSPRDRLRTCWLRLDWLAQETRDNWDNYEQGEQALDRLIADHRAALDDLVTTGDLSLAVADQVHTAFEAAAHHVWRSNAPITCYEAMPAPDYSIAAPSQLAQQAELLAEMAESGDLDPDTVAQARVAIERDIAFLSLSSSETQALYDELIKAAGDTYDFPSFDQVELDVTPEAVEAARFLVRLLLGEME